MRGLMSENQIRRLGFEWPKYALVKEYLDSADGVIDLDKMVAKMENSRAFYRKQLNDAYQFKIQTGADYSDFTDRYDEYARMERRLSEAIRYLEGIVRSQSKQG